MRTACSASGTVAEGVEQEEAQELQRLVPPLAVTAWTPLTICKLDMLGQGNTSNTCPVYYHLDVYTSTVNKKVAPPWFLKSELTNNRKRCYSSPTRSGCSAETEPLLWEDVQVSGGKGGLDQAELSSYLCSKR